MSEVKPPTSASLRRPTEQEAGSALYYEAAMLQKWLDEKGAPKMTEPDGIVYSLLGRVKALNESSRRAALGQAAEIAEAVATRAHEVADAPTFSLPESRAEGRRAVLIMREGAARDIAAAIRALMEGE